MPGLLNAQFDGLAKRTAEIVAKLGPNTRANDPIDRGLTDEFRAVGALQADYESLCELRSTLRSFGVIPSPDGYSWAANFRREFPVGAMKLASAQPDPGRARFLVAITHSPYCAANEAEARTTLEAAQREAVTA